MSTYFNDCYNDKRQTKIVWPADEVLVQMLKESNYTQVAKKLYVSDNAIRKHLAKRGLLF